MTAELLQALYGAGIAALGLVSIVLGVVARYVPEMIRTYLESKRLISMREAGTLAAQAVEERARGEHLSGTQKAVAAARIVQSIAPVATAKVAATQLDDVVHAGVAALRLSVPEPHIQLISKIPPPPRNPEKP